MKYPIILSHVVSKIPLVPPPPRPNNLLTYSVSKKLNSQVRCCCIAGFPIVTCTKHDHQCSGPPSPPSPPLPLKRRRRRNGDTNIPKNANMRI